MSGKNHRAAVHIALSLKKRDEAKLEITRKSTYNFCTLTEIGFGNIFQK